MAEISTIRSLFEKLGFLKHYGIGDESEIVRWFDKSLDTDK